MTNGVWNRFKEVTFISDPRRRCFMRLLEFIFFFFFFFFFFRHDLVRAISLEPSLVETPDWACCLVLRSNFALLLTIQFALLFYFILFFFSSATILSGPYLWNCYSQRLQIECAAWSCGLILHCCLMLTIQFASLISSLINIISLLLTTFDWTKVRGIAPRSHTGRPRTCLVLSYLLIIICFMGGHFVWISSQ